jgi:hypothetical protein
MKRREFVLGTAAGLFLPLSVQAQKADSIRELRGEVLVNGRKIGRDAVIRPGDQIATGAGGYAVFVVGQDAFMLRGRSELRLDPAPAQNALLSGLRLVTGALGAVFGKRPGGSLRVQTATVTAGIRGTGCYLEVKSEGTYFCTCHGTIELAAAANTRDRETLTATRHNNPRMIYVKPKDGQLFEPAVFATHTDAEMEMLERAVGRRAPWVKS